MPEEQPIVSLVPEKHTLENEWLRINIESDGSFNLTDKRSGQIYRELGVYENTGDIGNEYMYKQPNGEQALTTKGQPASIRLLADTSYRAAFEIVHEWAVPASAEDYFEIEKREAVYFPDRKSQRADRMVPLTIRTEIAISREGRGVEWKSSFNNQAKDHRVRVLFPTDLAAAVHHADSIFEIAKRDNEPAAEWVNPSNAQHQQAFVDVSGGHAGMTVANLGLHEYEVLRDGRNTIAITLLRSVAELGDWGVFPTPEAQCLGEQSFSLTVIPHNGDGAASGAYAAAYQFQVPWTAAQTGVHQGELAPSYSLIGWEGSGLAFSSLKVNEQSGDIVLRWFNMNTVETELMLSAAAAPTLAEAYKSDVLERQGDDLAGNGQRSYKLPVGPCEIVTLGFKQS